MAMRIILEESFMAIDSMDNVMTKGVVIPTVQESFAQYGNRVSTLLAVATGLLMGLLVILCNTDRHLVPLSNDLRSFGTLAFLGMLPLTAMMAGWGFIAGIRGWNKRVGVDRQRQWFVAFLPIALAYMVVAGGSVFVLVTLLEYAFRELQISMVQSALLTGSGAAALTFWIVSNAIKIDTQRLLTLAVTILAGGVYLTLVTIDDPLWWRVSFSYLGKVDSNVNLIFNTTLVLAGTLLLVWYTYLMKDYRILLRHGIADPRWALLPRYGLLWVGIAVMIVGLFKSQLTPFSSLMHNTAAYSLAGVFGLFMGAARWIVPGFPREFHALSVTVVGLLLGAILWAISGGVNTVGLELTVFGLGLMWLSQFARTVVNLAAEQEPQSFPK